jgi:hypothetical protein
LSKAATLAGQYSRSIDRSVFTCRTRDQMMPWCARRDLDVFGDLTVAGDPA